MGHDAEELMQVSDFVVSSSGRGVDGAELPRNSVIVFGDKRPVNRKALCLASVTTTMT
jgi:hypothetical protein